MSDQEENTIVFTAAVRQIKTLVDGGLVFIFDVPEGSIAQAAQLMAAKKAQIVLEVTCRAQGFTKKREEEEVLSPDQRLLKVQQSIEEKVTEIQGVAK